MILTCLRIGLISALLLMLILSVVGLITGVNTELGHQNKHLKEVSNEEAYN